MNQGGRGRGEGIEHRKEKKRERKVAQVSSSPGRGSCPIIPPLLWEEKGGRRQDFLRGLLRRRQPRGEEASRLLFSYRGGGLGASAGIARPSEREKKGRSGLWIVAKARRAARFSQLPLGGERGGRRHRQPVHPSTEDPGTS